MSNIPRDSYDEYLRLLNADSQRTPLSLNTSGHLEYKRDPGFFETVWDSQVGSTINQTTMGKILTMITSPIQSIQGSFADDTIHEGLMKTVDALDGTSGSYSKLKQIEEDPNALGRDWWNAYPAEAKKRLKEVGMEEPGNLEQTAAEFAKDFKVYSAQLVYANKTALGYDKYNDFGLLVGNIAVGAVTDPTNIAMFGLGLYTKAGTVPFKSTLAKGTALQFSLGAAQTLDRISANDELATDLGIRQGLMHDWSELIYDPIKEGAVSALIGGAFMSAAHAVALGAGKLLGKNVSQQSRDIAQSIHDSRPALSDADILQLQNRVNDSAYDTAPHDVQMKVLGEVVEGVYGTRSAIPEEAYMWDWMERFGYRPIDFARRVLENGWSGRQLSDIIDGMAYIIKDAEDLVTPNHPYGSATYLDNVNWAPAIPDELPAAVPLTKPTLLKRPAKPDYVSLSVGDSFSGSKGFLYRAFDYPEDARTGNYSHYLKDTATGYGGAYTIEAPYNSSTYEVGTNQSLKSKVKPEAVTRVFYDPSYFEKIDVAAFQKIRDMFPNAELVPVSLSDDEKSFIVQGIPKELRGISHSPKGRNLLLYKNPTTPTLEEIPDFQGPLNNPDVVKVGGVHIPEIKGVDASTTNTSSLKSVAEHMASEDGDKKLSDFLNAVHNSMGKDGKINDAKIEMLAESLTSLMKENPSRAKLLKSLGKSILQGSSDVGQKLIEVYSKYAETIGEKVSAIKGNISKESFIADYRKAYGGKDGDPINLLRYSSRVSEKTMIEFSDIRDVLAWQSRHVSSKDKLSATSGAAFEMAKKYFGIDEQQLRARAASLRTAIGDNLSSFAEAVDPASGSKFARDVGTRLKSGARIKVVRDSADGITTSLIERQFNTNQLLKAAKSAHESAIAPLVEQNRLKLEEYNKRLAEVKKMNAEAMDKFHKEVLGIKKSNRLAIKKYRQDTISVARWNRHINKIANMKKAAIANYHTSVANMWSAIRAGADTAYERFKDYGRFTKDNARDYMYFVVSGDYRAAHEMIMNAVGPGKYAEIKGLATSLETIRSGLVEAIVNGEENSKIMKIKENFDDMTSRLAQAKIALFEPSKSKLENTKLYRPIVAEGPITRSIVGDAAVSGRMYQTIGPGDTGNNTIPSSSVLALDRAMVNLPVTSLAKLIHTSIGEGRFSALANAIKSVEGSMFLGRDASRLLTSDVPMLGELVNLVSPIRLRESSAFGSTKMTPSFEARNLGIQAEGAQLIKDIINQANELGIEINGDAWHAASIAADLEVATGQKSSLPPVADKFKSFIMQKLHREYFTNASKEGVLAGRVKGQIDTYTRIILKDTSVRNLPRIQQAFQKAWLEFFLDPDSTIHKETLAQVTNNPIKAKRLADLIAEDRVIADEYLSKLNDPNGPLAQHAKQSITVRMGIGVLDDNEVMRNVSQYLNAGMDKKIDESILLDKSMHGFIETDIGKRIQEYNRNVRYYFVEQLAVDNWLSTNFNTPIKGISFNDLANYMQGILIDKVPERASEIREVFKSLQKKRGQITHRLGKNDDSPALDAAVSLIMAPVRTSVMGGITATSAVPEVGRGFFNLAKSMFSFAAKGPDGFFNNVRTFLSQLGEEDRGAVAYALHDAVAHTDMHELDTGTIRYAGGVFPNKWRNIKESFYDVGKAASSDKKGITKARDVVVAATNLPVEIVRQITFSDNMAVMAANMHHASARFDFGRNLMKFLGGKKLVKNDVTVRMESFGLFSKEAMKAIEAMRDYNPELFTRQFSMREINTAAMMGAAIHPDKAEHISNFVKQFQDSIESHIESRVMLRPRVLDMANPDASPTLNKFINMFSTYSRWWFNRNALQVFPNSASWKVGAYMGWFAMAESMALMARDAMRDTKDFEDMDSYEMFNKYGIRGMMNVPYFGQLSRLGTAAMSMFSDSLSQGKPGSIPISREFGFSQWYKTGAEGMKILRGENADYRKFIRGIPVLNVPIIEGLTARAAGSK